MKPGEKMDTVRRAILLLWRGYGIDPTDPNIEHVDPTKITVSTRKRDMVLAEVETAHPEIRKNLRVQWNLAYMNYAPKSSAFQEEDVLIEQGGVIYAGETVATDHTDKR